MICLCIVHGFTTAKMDETYAVMRFFSVFVCSQKSGHPSSWLTQYIIKIFYMPLKIKQKLCICMYCYKKDISCKHLKCLLVLLFYNLLWFTIIVGTEWCFTMFTVTGDLIMPCFAFIKNTNIVFCISQENYSVL